MINVDAIKTTQYFDEINWSEVKTKRFWYDDQPIVTHFMNAISLAIPESERFLVRVVKPYLSVSLPADVLEELKRFVAEENTHSLHHTKFNKDLKRHHYPVDAALKFISFGYGFLYKIFSKKTQLAIGVCFEHMTSVIATFGFDNEVMTEGISKAYDLFIWHAFEELNHRSVMHELYVLVGGGYFRRIFSMLYVTFFFITGVSIIQLRLLFSDLIARRGFTGKHCWYALKFFFGKKGMITGSMKHYLSIYRYHFIP